MPAPPGIKKEKPRQDKGPIDGVPMVSPSKHKRDKAPRGARPLPQMDIEPIQHPLAAKSAKDPLQTMGKKSNIKLTLLNNAVSTI